MNKTFIYTDKKSNKFWTIETNQDQLTVTYGKAGTAGQTSSKSFDTEEKCNKEAEKLIKEKIGKGYVEEGTKSTTATNEKNDKYYQNEFALSLVYTCKKAVTLKEEGIIYRKDNGKLNLPTGKIVATDPLTCYDTTPFRVTVAPGSYPCSVYVTSSEVLMAALFFTGKPAVRFEPALCGAEKVSEIKNKGDFYGFGVDAGMGSFMDEKTLKVVANMEDEGLFGVADSEDYVNYTLEPEDFEGEVKKRFVPDLNVVMYSSGGGDGVYPSYFGYDEDGNVCCLVTDFMMIDESDEIDTNAPAVVVEEDLVAEAKTLETTAVDLSFMDDDSEKPFLFFGAQTGDTVAKFTLSVKFADAPSKELKAQIVKSAGELGVSKKVVLPNYALAITNVECTANALVQWLMTIHSLCPVDFAVIKQGGKAKPTFTKWHYESLKTDRLEGIIVKYMYKYSYDKDMQLLTHNEVLSKYADGNFDDIALLRLFPYTYIQQFMQDKKKVPILKEFITNYHDKQIGGVKGVDENYGYQLGCGVQCALNNAKLDNNDVFDVVRMLFVLNVHSVGTICNVHFWFPKVVFMAAERGDSEFLNAITGRLVKGGQVHQNFDYIFAKVYQEVLQQYETNPTTAIKVYQYLFKLQGNKKPINNDLSIYCNALVVLQKAICGSVNVELNEEFLKYCLPYAAQNPTIYFNVSVLYAEMERFDDTLANTKKFFESKADNKAQLLEVYKTVEQFAKFREQKDAKEYLGNLSNIK